jgi:hypothetical protein
MVIFIEDYKRPYPRRGGHILSGADDRFRIYKVLLHHQLPLGERELIQGTECEIAKLVHSLALLKIKRAHLGPGKTGKVLPVLYVAGQSYI